MSYFYQVNLHLVKIIFKILEKNKIKEKNSFKYINNIAKSAKIDICTQNNNLIKALGRGRPKQN